MTTDDYNRRVAEALGRHYSTNTAHAHLLVPDYATDWTQLPAILAGIFEDPSVSLTIDLWADKASVADDGSPAYGEAANMLLAAGALLLKLAEQRGKP